MVYIKNKYLDISGNDFCSCLGRLLLKDLTGDQKSKLVEGAHHGHNIGGQLFLLLCVCVCVCVCMHAHMCVCVFISYMSRCTTRFTYVMV